MDYQKTAKSIYQAVGGEANINSLTHCMTRLRFRLKDEGQVDDQAVKVIPGVIGVNHQSGQYQVIMGNEVANYYQEVVKLGHFDVEEEVPETTEKMNLFDRFANFISSCMSPLIPALIGGGMIKVILILLPLFGWLSDKSQTYTLLSTFGDAPFYFLSMMLAFTAAKYFKVNPMLAITVAGIMIHPNFTAMVAAGKSVTFMGLPVTLATYSSSVIPILMMVWVMQYIERGVDKFCPASIKSILKPLLVIFISGVLALVIVGPIGTYAGKLLSDIILFIQGKAGWLAMGLMAAFMPLIVMTGMHWAFAPIFLAASISSPDTLILPAMLAANIAQGAASIAVAVKTKNKTTRQVASAASISALLAGVTEPALYGVTLKLKKPLYAAMISGGLTGIFMGIVNLKSFAFAVPSVIAMPQFVNPADGQNLINAIIVLVVAFILTFILTYILGFDEEVVAPESAPAVPVETPIESGAKDTKRVASPISGELIGLESVNDETFAQKMLGEGVAIIPQDNQVYAPFDGKVTTIFPTKHAIGLTSNSGIELLVHVGLDTVELKGKPFTMHVTDQQVIKKGQPLMTVDFKAIKSAGYDPTTLVIVTNTNEFVEVVPSEKTTVSNQDTVIYTV
ncbi:beta-glucoside-specific PTS transporter subunit IIABC [Latilactobacillus graminis]|uniref:PTS system sucrose-specific EIIBCA component n=2 Tax=Latilactobacillus graminis TaxID=60519 RepID=A0AA89I6G8_9LACO|nr:beta-glucoside-specific PTS transporter subunit IIABC [Latilactobacillus graminis]KRM24128.1 beta-glucoside-specific phosphotransferase system (PTS), IIABC component [Latilactobacillus graminis DSM 20719]QFP78884.1 PTS beta-glucoside transporter subunit IIBCA [Latilactobacillus graminis]